MAPREKRKKKKKSVGYMFEVVVLKKKLENEKVGGDHVWIF